MGLIRFSRRNSGVETLIKVLAVLTEDIELIHGEVLMSQFKMNGVSGTKMSLYLEPDPMSQIGIRNVWLQDVDNGVLITCANNAQAKEFLKEVGIHKNWTSAAPPDNRTIYHLDDLDKGAEDVRNFLMLGIFPNDPISPENQKWLNLLLKSSETRRKFEFDIVATLMDTI